MGSAFRAGMTLLVISLLFLAFNLVWAPKLPTVRWDFSEEKIHTLSPAAQQLLLSLESPLDLYYFNTLNAPQKSQALERYGRRVEDVLKAFEKAANGLINLHIINPAPFSEDAYKARLFGLDDTQGFLGLIGTRTGQGAQRIEAFRPEHESLLEYEISHLIYKLGQPERATIGLLSGLALDKSASELLGLIREQFNVVELAANIAQVPSSIATLIVVQPHALPERALYAIEQSVLKGTQLMMFLDPVSEMGADAVPANARMEGLLNAWGIQMPADKLLVDNLYASSATPGPGMPRVLHPARLHLPSQAMTPTDVSAWGLDAVMVSSSGALSLAPKSRSLLTPILLSSRQSALLDAKRFGSATTFDSLIDETATSGQRHVIAARVEGPAYSAFPDGLKGQPPGLQKAELIQMVVVADTDLLADTVSHARNGNAQFVLNTLDNLAAPEALQRIRSRVMRQPLHRLEHMRDEAAQAYRKNSLELQRRLEQTEQAWRELNPAHTRLITQAVDTNTQLQVLNKERLQLPIELHTLKAQAYAPVQRFERQLKGLMVVPLPLLLCLIAGLLFLYQRKRRLLALATFH
ncbi:MAG: ABC transporter [Pseudomonadales bacterium RIFCSPLOWO2_12_60_38]|uniref:Gldg family protein n=1 Tax=Pseudomonas TaxID=286 RepID=UPI000411C850|nr:MULTISPECIES: Gldg family protein [unclassified Pseudomonas]MBS6082711.1 Gldg family protein [Pseudomonas fluorescens]OHC33313.1 MAG: ABC transporter [Pseudomonadales bacterium RIFCSPLOWO2_12_60_38]OHC39363.1 MAG: ABC transporter [Pseudomonadales bacterium RIFCSPLOWO2_12_FULL_59_450]PTT08874.1 ABC transporter [Pseudomonas sp. HMWF034]PVV74333.1 ABC transporter [Pseudomonas sp. HMWF011]